MNPLSPSSLLELCERQINLPFEQIQKWFNFDPVFAIEELSRIFKQPRQNLEKSCTYLTKNIQRTEKTKRAFISTLIQEFPADLLFNPSNKMNISCFWKDQRHIHLLSKHICVVENNEQLLSYLEKIKIWELFPAFLKSHLQKEAETILKEEILETKKTLRDCFEWKIYTTSLASLALNSPEVILKKNCKNITDQNKNNLCCHAEKFLGTSLRLHLQSLQAQSSAENSFESFVNLLIRSIKILVPILKANPTLENKPAAQTTLLNQFLKFLGFETQIFKRIDLEPSEVCRFYHCFILIQDPFSQKSVLVDPSYSQYLPSAVLQTLNLKEEPILICQKGNIKKRINQFIKRANISTFPNEEKLWDLNGYEEVSFNQSAEVLFTSSIPRHTETHRALDEMLEEIGMKKEILTQDTLSLTKEILGRYNLAGQTNRLAENVKLKLLNELRRVYSPAREDFFDLLNLDRRPRNFLKLEMIGYYMAIQAQINADQNSHHTKALYFASGTDIVSPMLSLNASSLYLVDRNPIDIKKLRELKNLKTTDLLSQFNYLIPLIKHKKQYGGVKTEMMNKFPELCIIYEMACLGIKQDQMEVQTDEDETVSLHFSWAYHDKSQQTYKITFINADVTEPAKYPKILKNLLDEGIDYYYQKAAEDLPHYHSTFLPLITSAIKPKGYSLVSEIDREGIRINSDKYFENFTSKTETSSMLAYKKLLELPFFDWINDSPNLKASALQNDYWWNVTVRQKV